MKNLIRCLFGIPVVFSIPEPPQKPRMPVDLVLDDLARVGAERDEGGCFTGAGYRYCPSMEECIRPWEIHCQEFDFPYNALYYGSGIIVPPKSAK